MYGLLKDSVPQEMVQSVLCHDLHAPTQEFLQLGDKTAREPWAWIRSNVDQ
jgi:hypothetical protein